MRRAASRRGRTALARGTPSRCQLTATTQCHSSIRASRNLSRTPSRHCVISSADPGQNPSAVRFGGSQVQAMGQGGAEHGFLDRSNDRNPQAMMRFCKPICKPNAARRLEIGETQKARDDFAPHVCPGQGGDQRLPETPETHVVWLITQRSRGSNPAPATEARGPLRTGRGPLVRFL